MIYKGIKNKITFWGKVQCWGMNTYMNLQLKTCLPLLKFRAFPWTRGFPVQWKGEIRPVGIVTSWDCVPLCEWVCHVRTANPRAPFLGISYPITFLPSIKQTKEQRLKVSLSSLCKHTHTLSSHIPGYGKAWLWQVVWSVSVLIASVFWESCWIELDSSFLNLSAPVLG